MIKPIANNYINFKATPSQRPIEDSLKLHKKFEDNGFYEQPTSAHRFRYLYSEIEEFKEAVEKNDRENMEEEIGDVIFDAILLADYFKIDPVKALHQTNNKLNNRLDLTRKIAEKPLLEYTYQQRMEFWEKAKKQMKEENKDEERTIITVC